MTKDEALKLALEALEFYYDMHEEEADAKAITAIKEALAQPSVSVEQEPVAYVKTVIEALYENSDPVSVEAAELLERITTPPQRKPPQFPTMLRKMWSGSEVQDWINENWNKG